MRRVLVVFGIQMLAAALENLFAEEDKFQFVSIPFTDGRAALECIDDFRPDMLIFDEKIIRTEGFSPLGLLEVYPKLTIVIVNSDSNQVRIYEQRVISISRSSDLLTSILPR